MFATKAIVPVKRAVAVPPRPGRRRTAITAGPIQSAMHQRANTPANTLAQDPWALNDRDYEIGRNPSTALRDFVARRFDPAVAWNGHTNRCADPLEHRGAHVGGQQLVGFDDPRKRRRT